MSLAIKIIGGVIIAGALIYFGSGLFYSKQPASLQQPAVNQTTTGYSTDVLVDGQATTDSGGTIERETITDFTGRGVEVNKFKDKLKTIVDSDKVEHWYLGYDKETASTSAYVIEYFDDITSFAIYLLAEPLQETRVKAEQYILSALGIPPAQLCQLRYGVSVSYQLNPFFAGKDVGFSFCPGAVQL